MNNLIKNKFQLVFNDDKELENIRLDILSVNLPDISISNINIQKRGGVKVNRAGDTLDYSDLAIVFKMDEKLEHYDAIVNWIYDMSDPVTGRYANKYVTSSLLIFHPNGSLLKTITFHNMFPISMTPGTLFQTNIQDTEYQECTVNFKFDYMEI